MKVIHLATSAEGGAGIAARRTVVALQRQGVDALLWTADPSGDVELRTRSWGQWRSRIDRFPLRYYPERKLFSVWSNNFIPSELLRRVEREKPSIIHLHLVGSGVLDLAEFDALSVPLVWSMHDTWAFTGGCHYPGDCVNYRQACGACPQLGSADQDDLSRRNIIRKRAHYRQVSAWVTPSRWLYQLALESKAVPPSRLHCLPYGLDHAVFSSKGRTEVRRKLELSDDILAFAVGATYMGEERKGFHLVPAALRKISKTRKCVILQFGSGEAETSEQWPCPVRRVGVCRTEQQVADLYRAADVCLLPSLQDNLPNVALESLACGCPIVGFVPSGLSDIIVDGFTGKYTTDRTSAGLAQALDDWLAVAPSRSESSARCRASSELKYDMDRHAASMMTLYSKVLGPNTSSSVRRLEKEVIA